MFERYVSVDWSGAKRETKRSGLRIVQAVPEHRGGVVVNPRYCQMLWIAFDHAASFSSTLSTNSPLTNTAPALTRQTR